MTQPDMPFPASDLDAQYQRYVRRWVEFCRAHDIDYKHILWVAPDAAGRSLSRLFEAGCYRELYLYRDSLPYGNEM